MGNWDRKEELARKAKIHNMDMEDFYLDEINYSVENSRIYMEDFKGRKSREVESQEIVFLNMGTVEAIFNEDYKGKVAVLNFASYKYPGGGYLSGSKAQEECLCHSSCLYNVLLSYEETFYELNRKSTNRSLYYNRAIYSEDIVFFDENENSKKVDVITCASPNKYASLKFCGGTEEDNTVELKSRIKFVLNIAENENVDVLILGAYGCGVFGQDPVEVSKIFMEVLSRYKRFKKVIFAVPGNDRNVMVFKKAVGGVNE